MRGWGLKRPNSLVSPCSPGLFTPNQSESKRNGQAGSLGWMRCCHRAKGVTNYFICMSSLSRLLCRSISQISTRKILPSIELLRRLTIHRHELREFLPNRGWHKCEVFFNDTGLVDKCNRHCFSGCLQNLFQSDNKFFPLTQLLSPYPGSPASRFGTALVRSLFARLRGLRSFSAVEHRFSQPFSNDLTYIQVVRIVTQLLSEWLFFNHDEYVWKVSDCPLTS